MSLEESADLPTGGGKTENVLRAQLLTEYLTPKQASEIYGLSPSYFTRHADWFGGIRVGGGEHRAGRWRFTRENIERFLKKQTQKKLKN